MAKDAELDRLKAAQDTAFQRKQDAYEVQQRAWEKRSSARDVMNRAHEEKQRAYSDQDSSWQDFQRVKSSLGYQIDSLNAQQEAAYENMKRAFDNASAAYQRRDGTAGNYSAEGHRHKADAQSYTAERRRLVDRIRSARASHEVTKPAFNRAKDSFNSAKRTFEQAKAEHERAQATFKQAKAEFDRASKAFRNRLDTVKADGKKRHEKKRSLAEKAGVPFQYRDKVWTSKGANGNINLYFGGVGDPNGPGHGHYVLDRTGSVTYKRDPFDPHGTQNFTDKDDDGRGTTLYDRRARSKDMKGFSVRDNVTRKSESGGGTFYDRNKDTDLHVTQYYDDSTRVSWDGNGKTDKDRHWTNQNLPPGHPDRHTPPDDARK